ncbi:MAG: nucleoside-diphosphate sugar epimerase/dehydratase [Candidatus Sericytochromatia bacterium]|nr:nucleoside-diphosphate sugar epimerase/dehydratase [Candidatus Sericytochromatia bacterium]
MGTWRAALADLVIVLVAWSLAFVLRFEGLDRIPTEHASQFLRYLVLLPLLRIVLFGAFGLYRQVWRYVGLGDVAAMAKAVLAGSAILALVDLLLDDRLPRSVLALEGLLTLAGVLGLRFVSRARAERRARPEEGAVRTLIVGAGDAGELLVRDMLRHPARGFAPVAFLDDDAAKLGRRIHGVPVMGGRADMAAVAERTGARLVVVAMPGAAAAVRRAVARRAVELELEVKTLPALGDLLQGEAVTTAAIREVPLEDLLGREVTVTDESLLSAVSGQCVLVTGAGGSIGSELCRQIAARGPGHLVLLGHGENSLYLIETELKARHPELSLEVVVADVRDEAAVRALLQRIRPALVVHAAAHKHVPLMESNVVEAASNNVLGTGVLAQAALEAKVPRFVLISTDKAVRPTSVMGMTKRAAERLIQDLAAREGATTVFMAVRFGNVLGSRGSVVPLFQRQIREGGPLTVTHPEMRRYFMTIPEAVTLVLQAAALGRGGEILLLEMGAPVRILDLARRLIRLSGLPEDAVPIRFTGVRPGEKLFEELSVSDETARPTAHPQVFALRAAMPPEPADWASWLTSLKAAVANQDQARTRALLQEACEGANSPDRETAPLGEDSGEARRSPA